MATFVITATLSAAAIYLLRMFIKGKRFSEMVNAKDKVVIITGASSGIGKQLTRELNLRGAKVYMFCRDEDKTFQARLDLVRYGCDPTRMTYIHCDLSDIFSIKKAVDDFKKEEPVLDILINNAGIMYYPDFKLTNDNCELTWQTNYLGHFVLTELLIPYLEKSDDGRIINVSSGSEHRCKELNLEKINSSEYFGRMDSYSRSKLAQVMHAIELTKRLRANNPLTKITINSCEPGVVNTNICRYTFLDIKFFNCLLAPVRWFFLKTSNDGAQCPLFLALSKKLYGISGKHFKDCAEKSNINHLAMNEELCSELYDYSLQYVN
uniref:Dehydrogenase/reductase SDR family member on chromosome X n=1 Tax=Parastrongyloides trichosuri TaxID=131310 RepID=A0A0N5A650_PARTI